MLSGWAKNSTRLEKLGFEKNRKKIDWLIRLGRRTSIGRDFYIYRLGRTYVPLPNRVTNGLYKANLTRVGLHGIRPVWPVGPRYFSILAANICPLPFWWALQAKKQVLETSLVTWIYTENTRLKIILRAILHTGRLRLQASCHTLRKYFFKYLPLRALGRHSPCIVSTI